MELDLSDSSGKCVFGVLSSSLPFLGCVVFCLIIMKICVFTLFYLFIYFIFLKSEDWTDVALAAATLITEQTNCFSAAVIIQSWTFDPRSTILGIGDSFISYVLT